MPVRNRDTLTDDCEYSKSYHNTRSYHFQRLSGKSIVDFYLEDFMLDEYLCLFRAELSIARPTVETRPAVEMYLRLVAVRAGNGLMFPIEHFLSGLLLTVKCFSTEPVVLSARLEQVLSTAP
jgi:hypothetical protein